VANQPRKPVMTVVVLAWSRAAFANKALRVLKSWAATLIATISARPLRRATRSPARARDAIRASAKPMLRTNTPPKRDQCACSRLGLKRRYPIDESRALAKSCATTIRPRMKELVGAARFELATTCSPFILAR